MIKAIIFDLDNCLAAADEVGELFFRPAFNAMRASNTRLTEAQLLRAFADVWKHSLDWVAATHQFSDEMLQAGWQVFANLEITQPLQGYGDLQVLTELPVRRFLVTSGFRRLQESKIRALGIASCFEQIIVDAIDEPDRIGKRGHFKRLLKEQGLQPVEVLVVGDNPDSELAAGKQLGMITIQTLRPGVQKTGLASAHVHSLTELRSFL